MKLVLKAVFARSAVQPVERSMETPRRRAITISPRAGGTVVLTSARRMSDKKVVAKTAA
jgi:hypothetical protein